MTAQLIEAGMWVGVLAVAILASLWLWNTLGVGIASVGLIANTSALMFARMDGWGFDGVISATGAVAMGVMLGLLHLALLRATNKDILLVTSVLLTFLWNDIWLSLPTLTGGSGGVVAQRSYSEAVIALAAAVGLCSFLYAAMLPRSNRAFVTLTARQHGLESAVLGVSTWRIFGGGFAATGAVFGLLGVCGASLTGIVSPTLFSTAWSLSVLVVVVAPAISPSTRILVLPVIFVAARLIMREILPVSIGFSQFVEVFFPAAVLLWSRVSKQPA